jgi:hypothetical protein
MKPHGQEEERDEAEQRRHRAAADLAGVGRGARRRLGSPGEGLGLEPTERGESEGAAGWAEPVWSSPLEATDRWAQAVSQPF